MPLAHNFQRSWDFDYRVCVYIEPGYLVKYDKYGIIWPEIAKHLYISSYAESQADAPRIPKVIHHVRGDRGRGYLVLEYIKLKDPSPLTLPEGTAKALEWVPAPPEHVMGPLGGGCIRSAYGLLEHRGLGALYGKCASVLMFSRASAIR